MQDYHAPIDVVGLYRGLMSARTLIRNVL